MKKTWDNPVAEFLLPKGLVKAFLVALGLCLVLIIPYRINGAAKLKEANKDIQTAIAEKRYADATELLKSYIRNHGGDNETDKIWNDLLTASVHGCWKGYGEWKTEIQDSNGERYLYLYYPAEGDPLYVAGEHEAYYLVFSDTELSSANEVIQAYQANPQSCYLTTDVKFKFEKHLGYKNQYTYEGSAKFYEAYPGHTSTYESFDIKYDLDNFAASVWCWTYNFDEDNPSGDICSDISLERME